MGMALAALFLATDFWRSLIGTPEAAALEEGTLLSRQAEQTCPGCSEEAPRFAEARGLWRRAAAAYARAAALRREDPEPAFYVANALYEAHDFEAAIAALAEARHRRPDGARAGEIASHLGIAFSRVGRFQDAVDEYVRALHLSQDPSERAILYINTAEAMMALGRLEEAIAMYRRGIDAGQLAMRSGSTQAQSQALHLLGLAVALDRDEQGEKALVTARRALELDPALSQLRDPHVFFVPDGDIVYYEALRELAQGRRAEAAHDFAEFLRVVPRSGFAARARAHLAELGVKSLPPSRPTGPSARLLRAAGVTSSDGPLTAPELDAAMKTHWPALAGCFVDLEGTRTIEITVSARGAVTRSRLVPASPQAQRCLDEIAHGWSFRPADHARPTHFNYRVVLGP